MAWRAGTGLADWFRTKPCDAPHFGALCPRRYNRKFLKTLDFPDAQAGPGWVENGGVQRVQDRALPQETTVSLRVESLAHTHLADCYQCGKCTAGCPVSAHMDLVPNQVIRLLQLGQAEVALRSQAIWECVSCQTCSTRCPKEVDCAGIMDALREFSLSGRMVAPAQQPVVSFQEAFLANIRRNGRLAELELIARFKADVVFHTGRLGFIFKDAGLAPQLSKRKKLHLMPEKARDRKVVGRIFARCRNQSES